jgi:hypothetical protein
MVWLKSYGTERMGTVDSAADSDAKRPYSNLDSSTSCPA